MIVTKKKVFVEAEYDYLIKSNNIIGKKYYLYIHYRLDKNEPFYIGVGTLDRGKYYYRAICKKKRNNIWFKITNKTKYTIFIVEESDNRQDILYREIQYIELLGKISNNGILSNLTDGGEGHKGIRHIMTKEMKDKIILSNKTRVCKESTREKHRNNIYNSNIIGRKGVLSYVSKPVEQIAPISNEIINSFVSVRESAKYMKVTGQSISSAIKNNTKVKKFNWRFKHGDI